MVKINYAELKFDHLVIFDHDRTIFACARENGNGHTRIFLIFDGGKGRVYTRNGRIESWEQLFGNDADNIRYLVAEARYHNIPVYKVNGSTELVTVGTDGSL